MNSVRLSSIQSQKTFFLLIFFLALFLSIGAFGQEISSSEAKNEARAASRQAGFETIFFTSKILGSQLNNAQGINIYSGLPAREKQSVLMIIGANTDGSEIGDQFVQNNEKSELKMIDRATKESQVTNIENNNKLLPIKTFFSTSDLQGLLSQPGVTGLHFMPSKVSDADGNELLTLIVAAASSPTNTMEMTALRSPCPPECNQ